MDDFDHNGDKSPDTTRDELPHACPTCGARYYGADAASGCCLANALKADGGPVVLTDGGKTEPAQVERTTGLGLLDLVAGAGSLALISTTAYLGAQGDIYATAVSVGLAGVFGWCLAERFAGGDGQ